MAHSSPLSGTARSGAATTHAPTGARRCLSVLRCSLLALAVLVTVLVCGQSSPEAEAGGFGFKKVRKSIERRVKCVGDELQNGADKVGDTARKAARSRPARKVKEAVEDAGSSIAGVARKGAQAVERGVRSASKRIGFGYRSTQCTVAKAVSNTAAKGVSSVAAVTSRTKRASKPCPPPACTAPC